MKHLIKLTIIAIFLFGGIKSMSQTFGLKAGLNLSSMNIKYSISDDKNLKINPGFHFGPTLEIPINDLISFESGLLLSTKGFKIKREQEYLNKYIKQKAKLNLFCLDIPITAKITVDAGNQKIYGVFGPYFSAGLNGNYNSDLDVEGNREIHDLDVKFGSNKEEGDLKRFDYGLTAGAGIIFNSFQIGINYSLGLADVNIFKYSNNATKATNSVIGISAGYKFGKT